MVGSKPVGVALAEVATMRWMMDGVVEIALLRLILLASDIFCGGRWRVCTFEFRQDI